MQRIAIINQKGGVGKTTTVANLGAALARAGKRVVVFDMDPQANLSLYLGSEVDRGEASVYGVLTDNMPIEDALRPTNTPGLFLVASHLDLSGAELELASTLGRETLLRDALTLWEAQANERDGHPPADYILLDCPPSLGLLSINALVAADEVMIAVQTEFFALQGLSKLVEVVQLLRRRMNPGLTLTGILPCLYDSRLKLAREVLAELRRFFPGKVYPTPVRSNVRLAESPSHGMTIFEYAPESNGAKDYAAMGAELLRRSPTEDIQRPSQIEVINDDQAKELLRAAEGLRDLEPPAPEHRTKAQSDPSDDAPEDSQEPDVEAETSEAAPLENAEAQASPSQQTGDGVEAELAAYDLPRPKLSQTESTPEQTVDREPGSESMSPQASDTSTVLKAQVSEAIEGTPAANASPEVAILEEAEASSESGTDIQAGAQAKETSALEETPKTPTPPPTPVMGFADYIGEDRWVNPTRHQSGG